MEELQKLLSLITDNWVLITGAIGASSIGIYLTNKVKRWANVQNDILKWLTGAMFTTLTVLMPALIQAIQNNAINLERVGITTSLAVALLQLAYLVSKSIHGFLGDVSVARDARLTAAKTLKLAGGSIEKEADAVIVGITPVTPADFND